MDFNPLDLLAAAAALQRDDPKTTKQSGGNKNSDKTDCDGANTEEATEEEDSNSKMGSARKVRSEIKRQNSCNLPSDVGKLFGSDLRDNTSVEAVTEDDLPGRSLRRHSWSADGSRDISACEADITKENLVSADVGEKKCAKETEKDLEHSETEPPYRGESNDARDLLQKTDSVSVDLNNSVAPVQDVSVELGSFSEVSGSDNSKVLKDSFAEADQGDVPEESSTEDRTDLTQKSTTNPVCHTTGSVPSDGPSAIFEKSTETETVTECNAMSTSNDISPSDLTNNDVILKTPGDVVKDDVKKTRSDLLDGPSCLLESYLTGHLVKPLRDKHSAADGSEFGGVVCRSVEFDHSYACHPGKEQFRGTNSECDDTGAESDSCGENSSADDVENRTRSLSIESACLRFGFDDKRLSFGDKGQDDSDHMSTEASLLSPTSSVDSSLTDFPPVKLTPLSLPVKDSSLHHQLQGYSSSDGCDDRLGSPTSSLDSLHGQIPSKIGRFRIGTFASFSSSNVKSETPVLKNGSKTIRLKDHSNLTSPFFDKGLMGSPPGVPQSPGIPSFLQSPCGDWDRSDAGSEVQDELGPPHCMDSYMVSVTADAHETASSDISSVSHDHDYCLREGHEAKDMGSDINSGKSERRRYQSWAKTKSGIVRHIKEPKLKSKTKVKKIKTEPLEVSTPPEEVPDFKQPFEVDMSQERSNVVLGRTSKRRLEKLERLQEQLELDNGSKLKITGKFKDDYVYYLNKSSRSRRRASTDLPPALPTDKIILPAPKPGDIIVPHLTDADIEAIKLRGKAGLSISEKYYGAGLSSALHSNPGAASKEAPAAAATSGSSDTMADMDSKIISTILSMENDIGSPSSAQDSSISDSVDLYSPSEDSVGINFMGENMTLTADQVNMLLDAVKDVETTPDEIIDSAGVVKYNLDNNQNYDDAVEHLEVSTSDRKSVDGASTADESERRQSVSSVASELEPESKVDTEVKEPSVFTDQDSVQTVITSSESESVPETTIDTVSVSASNPVVEPQAVNPHESPVKALLEADLQTIGESAPPLRDFMSTIEKPFDFIENDFRLDKQDLFSDTTVMDQSTPSVTTAASTSTSAASDYQTPWIVTVTMFWNDLPAIMIDNQPFVRLVDIHKQILPAKDTGILKKRCQLLSIEVLNCSEMQRYFLVQYGRAYNSKSTLIVAKDDAKGLIGYYVNPQPRVAKPDEVKREDYEVAVESPQTLPQSVESIPVKAATPAFKKRVRPKAPPKTPPIVKSEVPQAPTQVSQPLDIPISVPEVPKQVTPPQESKRLRHKKINFLELLKGETSSDTSTSETPDDKKAEEDSETGRRSISAPASPASKKKAKLSDAEKLKLVKDELKKRKIELPEEPQKKVPRVVEQDSEEENHSAPTRRKLAVTRPRGHHSSVNGNRTRSRLKKAGPLKVKIKGLLHFKKGNKKNSSGNSDKIIEIRHKDPKPTNAHPVVTQDGDIHLDLYQKKSSLCIKCCSCKKFFSLRNFLTHQHYPDDSEKLTTVAQPQVLEPRISKLSEKKKNLWQEFNKRRKQLEGTKPVSEPKPIVLSKTLNIVNKSVIPTTSPLVDSKTDLPKASVNPPGYKPGSALEAELRKKTDLPRFKHPLTVTTALPRVCNSSGVRVSSRKRKERQLFPIENYSYAKKVAKMDMPLNGEGEVEVSEAGSTASPVKAAAAVASNCVLTLSNGPELTHYTALQDAPEI